MLRWVRETGDYLETHRSVLLVHNAVDSKGPCLKQGERLGLTPEVVL